MALGAGWRARFEFALPAVEQHDGRWTGRILGEAMFAEAKARAIRRVVAEEDLDLRAMLYT